MSVAQQNIAQQITYDDLYRRWEEGNWKATELDFTQDKQGWESLSEIQRKSAMWVYSMFFYGEDAVADGLSPYIEAAPKEEQKYFLATQQVDEARHAVFFHRFFKEVIGVEGDIATGLEATLAELGWGYRNVFGTARADGRGAPHRPLPPQVRPGDHALPHGHRGDDGPADPALHRGLLRQGGDDAWLQRGNGEGLAGRAAPHRLRGQGSLGAVRRVRGVQGRRRRAPQGGPAVRDRRSSCRPTGTSATPPSTASPSPSSTPGACTRSS